MRRLSMKSKKGKSDEASDNETSIKEESSGESNAVSEGESVASDDAKTSPKKNKNEKKNKRGRKKQSNSEVEDGGPETKRKKRSTAAEKDENETEEYEVENIVDMKVNRGKRLFKIRWKGYGPESDTWKDEGELSCPEMVKIFLETNEKKTDKTNKKRGAEKSVANNKSPKKKKTEDVKEDEIGDNVEYEVDKVMEVHFKKNGVREFLIHWKGFSHKDDTWEPEKNLNCPDLIEKFMAKLDKAKASDSRELRVNPTHTDRFTLNMSQAGRRLSRRNQGKQRATYHGYE